MSFEQFIVPELEVPVSEIKPVLRCVLHTIFFHRALGLTHPRDVYLEKYGITYASCGNVDMEPVVETRVNEFFEYMQRSKHHRGQIKIRFFEKREQGLVSKAAQFMGFQEDKVCWEEWVVNLRISQHRHPSGAAGENAEDNGVIASQLSSCIMNILTAVNTKKDHIPPVPKELTGLQSFYHEVVVVHEASSSSTFSAIQGIAGAKLI